MSKAVKLKNVKIVRNRSNGQINLSLPKKIVKDFISDNDDVINVSLWKPIKLIK